MRLVFQFPLAGKPTRGNWKTKRMVIQQHLLARRQVLHIQSVEWLSLEQVRFEARLWPTHRCGKHQDAPGERGQANIRSKGDGKREQRGLDDSRAGCGPARRLFPGARLWS